MKTTPTVSPKSVIDNIVNHKTNEPTKRHVETEVEKMNKDDFAILVQQAREKIFLSIFVRVVTLLRRKAATTMSRKLPDCV